MTTPGSSLTFVLITPVHNEGAHIEKTMASVLSQTRFPLRWVIVDDGSTDSTPEIVARLAGSHDWIEVVRLERLQGRSFSSKVRCFNAGYDRVRHLSYDIIGNLDGDVSFQEDYFAFLLERFLEDETLGVAGTVFREVGYRSDLNSFEGQAHVPGGCQLFRRECFESIGGYTPSRHGGVDWIAVTTARMLGWKTRAFRERYFFHHRQLGTAQTGGLAAAYAYGQKDYALGGHPLWELIRVVYRTTRKPYFIGGLALGLGFMEGYFRRPERSVSRDFIAFHKAEQMAKLKAVAGSALRFKRIDPFSVVSK